MSRTIFISEEEIPLQIAGFGIVGDYGCSRDYFGQYIRDDSVYNIHITFEEISRSRKTKSGYYILKMTIYEANDNLDVIDTFLCDTQLDELALAVEDFV